MRRVVASGTFIIFVTAVRALEVNAAPANSSATPEGRSGHAMVYDRARECIVLFGGQGANPLADTWEWDGAMWRVGPKGPAALTPRRSHGMAFDGDRNLTVLYGGYGPVGAVGDTWEYDGKRWSQRLHPPHQPGPRTAPILVFDERHSRIVLAGGNPGDPYTWELTAGGWRRGAQTPVNFQEGVRGAYDTARGVLVMFGGSETSEAIWEYEGSSWKPGIRLRSSDHVSRIVDHAMAYDEGRGVVVTFGGRYDTSHILFGTWEYDGTALKPGPDLLASPMPHRFNAAMAYDGARRRMILFGGRGAGGASDETWAYDGTTWQRAASPSGPVLEDHLASVSGAVADTEGKPLVTAVKLTREDRHVSGSFQTRTGSDGIFAFPSVAPGAYVLHVEHAGYRGIELPLTLHPNEAFTAPLLARRLDQRLRVICNEQPTKATSPSAEIRAQIDEVLKSTARPDTQPAVVNAVSDLQQLGPEAFPVLTELLPSLPIPALWAAARVLGDGCHRPAAPALAACLAAAPAGITSMQRWNEFACYLTVIRALGNTGDDAQLPPLVRFATDSAAESEIRREALAALAAISTPEALAAIDKIVASTGTRRWLHEPCPGLSELVGRCAPGMHPCGQGPPFGDPYRWETMSQRLSSPDGSRQVLFRSDILGSWDDLWLLELDRSGDPVTSRFIGQVPVGRQSWTSFTAWWQRDELNVLGNEGTLLRLSREDAQRDGDGDGLTDRLEARIGLNPGAVDSDSDGVSDAQDTNPLTPKGQRVTGEAAVLEAALRFRFGARGLAAEQQQTLVIVSDVPVDCPWCPGLTLWRSQAADMAASSRHSDRSAKRIRLSRSGRGPLIELRPDEAIYELSVGERGYTLVIRTRAGRSDVVAQVGSSTS